MRLHARRRAARRSSQREDVDGVELPVDSLPVQDNVPVRLGQRIERGERPDRRVAVERQGALPVHDRELDDVLLEARSSRESAVPRDRNPREWIPVLRTIRLDQAEALETAADGLALFLRRLDEREAKPA